MELEQERREGFRKAMSSMEKTVVALKTTVEMNMKQQEKTNLHFEEISTKLFQRVEENSGGIQETRGLLSALKFVGGFIAIIVLVISLLGLLK